MRIIDSNKDYYDFYQNIYRDNTLVFDRRDSYNLTKDEFKSNFYYEDPKRYLYWGNNKSKDKDVVLQICNTFWLFNLTITNTDDYGKCTDYELKLIGTWKDYSVKSELIKLSHIKFWRAADTIDKKIEAIRLRDYRAEYVFDKFYVAKSNGNSDLKEEKHIPILQNIGIASLVKPLDIYLAFEEYLSTQKTNTERTESVGLTNDEKVTNHGFDIKKSFRSM